MHFHFDFSATQILWTLTLAALLILLVVLLGRDRVRRFPWFTAAMMMMALRMIASRLLFERMAPLVSSEVFLIMSDVASVIALLMVVEIARHSFAGASRKLWLIATSTVLAVAAAVVVEWGPWPSLKTVFAPSTLGHLRMMQLFTQKADLFSDLLLVQIGILVLIFGSRFKAGWRSHPQQIAIGLSTASLSQLVVRIIWQQVALHATIHSQAEYQKVMALQEKIYHGNSMVYLGVLIWWIGWLWLDEPGAGTREMAAEQVGVLNER